MFGYDLKPYIMIHELAFKMIMERETTYTSRPFFGAPATGYLPSLHSLRYYASFVAWLIIFIFPSLVILQSSHPQVSPFKGIQNKIHCLIVHLLI